MYSGCHQCELPADQEHEEAHTQAKAHYCVIEERSIPAITGKVTGISGHRRWIAGHLPVEQSVGELHAGETQDDGGMGIARGVGERMVLAMDRHPLSRLHAGERPCEHPTRCSDAWRELQRAVRKTPMKIDRRHQEGDL